MLPKIRAERPNVPVIMITAYGDGETRRHAIAHGAIGNAVAWRQFPRRT
jgi:DNA-binding NtrC family response regulator